MNNPAGEQNDKRYYNDILIYDNGRYYYPDGSLMIALQQDYWQFYEENGQASIQLPYEGEQDDWLLTPVEELQADMPPEWETVRDTFNNEYFAQKLPELPIPAFLQKEKGLPVYIIGLFADDQVITKACAKELLTTVDYQIAGIVATQLPHYPHLVSFLFDMMAMPDIDADKKAYNQLIKKLTPAVQILLNNAADADDITALKAMYLLYHIGAGQDLLRQTWNDTTHSLFRRSYALFALGERYLKNQKTTLIDEFTASLQTTTDPLLRLILLLHLVTAATKDAPPMWLAELMEIFADTSSVQSDFNQLHPFVGDYDAQEYILITLSFANLTILEKHMAAIIDMLPLVHAMKQETLLDIIFTVLFSKKSALKKTNILRKQALLTAADIMEQEVIYHNHKEIFYAHNLPVDPKDLRKLAWQQ